MTTFCGFDFIPNEITDYILSFTGSFEAIASQTCRLFRALSLNSKRIFGDCPSKRKYCDVCVGCPQLLTITEPFKIRIGVDTITSNKSLFNWASDNGFEVYSRYEHLPKFMWKVIIRCVNEDFTQDRLDVIRLLLPREADDMYLKFILAQVIKSRNYRLFLYVLELLPEEVPRELFRRKKFQKIASAVGEKFLNIVLGCLEKPRHASVSRYWYAMKLSGLAGRNTEEGCEEFRDLYFSYENVKFRRCFTENPIEKYFRNAIRFGDRIAISNVIGVGYKENLFSYNKIIREVLAYNPNFGLNDWLWLQEVIKSNSQETIPENALRDSVFDYSWKYGMKTLFKELLEHYQISDKELHRLLESTLSNQTIWKNTPEMLELVCSKLEHICSEFKRKKGEEYDDVRDNISFWCPLESSEYICANGKVLFDAYMKCIEIFEKYDLQKSKRSCIDGLVDLLVGPDIEIPRCSIETYEYLYDKGYLSEDNIDTLRESFEKIIEDSVDCNFSKDEDELRLRKELEKWFDDREEFWG